MGVQGGDVELLAPYVGLPDSTQTLPTHSVTIHGTKVKFAVTTATHIALIVGHIKRELHGKPPAHLAPSPPSLRMRCLAHPLYNDTHVAGYALMKDAINAAAGRLPSGRRRPLVVDVGANHGLYALYAALLGADVIVVEPQASLCKVINYAAKLNGVSERIELHNNAVLEQPEMVSMQLGEVAEGAVASVKRPTAGGTAGGTQALPISTLVPDSKGPVSGMLSRTRWGSMWVGAAAARLCCSMYY